MHWKPSIVAAVMTLAASGGGFGPAVVGVAHAECAPGETIDGSTVDQARRKIVAAGFRAVSGLKKSCDNYWHGKAIKDGVQVRVVLSPQGQAQTEGD